MIGKLFSFLLVLIVPLLLIGGALLEASTSKSFYQEEVKKLPLNSIEKQDALFLSEHTRNYLLHGGSVDAKLIGERAALHMPDVKRLYTYFMYGLIGLGSFFFLGLFSFALRKQGYRIPRILVGGALLTLVINGIIFLISYFSFEKAFWNLHEILYTNDYWQLSPNTDPLIRVFTETFFIHLTQRVLLISSLVALCFILALAWRLKLNKRSAVRRKSETAFQWQ